MAFSPAYVHPQAEVSPEAEIGAGTRVWRQLHVREHAHIGEHCNIGKGVYVDAHVRIGSNVKIQNHVSLFEGVTLEDGVFIGPHVHFVCRGNLYRGRLAEAYLRSKQIPGLTVTSSGTEADEHQRSISPISWEALRLLKNHRLVVFTKLLPEKTTEMVLSRATVVIFFGEEIYAAVRARFAHLTMNHQIWDIPDIALPDYRPSVADDTRCVELSEETFTRIRQHVDALVEKTLHALHEPRPRT